jgi:hypothetical protein
VSAIVSSGLLTVSCFISILHIEPQRRRGRRVRERIIWCFLSNLKKLMQSQEKQLLTDKGRRSPSLFEERVQFYQWMVKDTLVLTTN